MPHRPPTRFDIGKTVEVSDDGNAWRNRELYMIGNDYVRIMLPDGGVESWRFCRVPYTTPDPIAELSAAADWLAERGQDEAARVLLREIETQRKVQLMKDTHAQRVIAASNCIICNGAGGRWDDDVPDQWYYCVCQDVNNPPEPQP